MLLFWLVSLSVCLCGFAIAIPTAADPDPPMPLLAILQTGTMVTKSNSSFYAIRDHHVLPTPTDTDTSLNYQIFTSSSYWSASFPPSGDVKATYRVTNVSYEVRRSGDNGISSMSYIWLLNGTCTAEMRTTTNVTADGSRILTKTVETPFVYVASAPCDVMTGGVGTTCRMWTQNYTFVPNSNHNFYYYQYFFATDSDTWLGMIEGQYDRDTNEPLPFYVSTNQQYTYIANPKQAMATLPKEAWILPDACKQVAPQGSLGRTAAFDGPIGASSHLDISMSLLLLLGAATTFI